MHIGNGALLLVVAEGLKLDFFAEGEVSEGVLGAPALKVSS